MKHAATRADSRGASRAFSTLNSGLRDETIGALISGGMRRTFSTLNSGLRDETWVSRPAGG